MRLLSLISVALASVIGVGLVASAHQGGTAKLLAALPHFGWSSSSDTKQLVQQFLLTKLQAGAPTLYIKLSPNIIQSINANTAQGKVSPPNQIDWLCVFEERLTVGSSEFHVRSPANHGGNMNVPPLDWLRWANRRDIIKEITVTYLGEAGPRPKMVSQDCRVFMDNPSLAERQIQLAQPLLSISALNPFQLNTAQFGFVPAYYVEFKVEVAPLYSDVLIRPNQLTGHARFFFRPDTKQLTLVDYDLGGYGPENSMEISYTQ